MRPMRLPVALVQLDATGDVDANIACAVQLADEAAAGGARLVALPEYLQFRGPDAGFLVQAMVILASPVRHLARQPLPG